MGNEGELVKKNEGRKQRQFCSCDKFVHLARQKIEATKGIIVGRYKSV
jgi:hypothetical protein